jgi:hypothetical protein
MPKKWGLITSGATFQSLACTLIFFEDSKAALFGRPGRDGAQDARSGDGMRVFQMKHHLHASAAAAIRDAKEEATTVAKYRKPGHPRHPQWLGVKHWRLVTNAAFNTTDQQRWDDEVVPLFKALGFDEVDRWSQEHLEALLDKHPEVHRAYFENETRAFLSVPEMRERVHAQEPFLRRDDVGAIFGRTVEVDTARTFLGDSSQFLVIHGAGGIGKTRLLLEIGEAIASEGTWYVLWANVATMSATSTWFDGVVRERPTLLLVDEPDDDKLLKVLLEQLGSRASKWKVAITVRSPKDPVLRFLFGARMKPLVQELPIAALLEADAVAMCESLLATGKLASRPEEQRKQAARDLSKHFARHPVWLTLAVQHLEDRGDLTQVPASAQDLADEYLREIETNQADVAREVVRNLIRWVALIGKLNREDAELIEQLGNESGVGSGTQVLERLNSLVKRRVLIERGRNDRLVELKPDVLRDHVLLRWLSKDVGFGSSPIVPSDEAKALLASIQDPVAKGSLDRLGRAKLVSLARTEFLLELGGHKVEILAPLFDAIRSAVPSMSASKRVALTEVLESVAVPQPLQVVSLIRALRSSHVDDERIEGVFGDRVVGQTDVILSLGWPLAHAAMGARADEVKEEVLRELCAVVGAEIALAPGLKHGLPNDGKRGASLVARVVEGGPEYWGDFDAAGKKLSLEILDAIAARPPTPGESALLKALIQPVMAIERRQTWSDDRSIHFRTFRIAAGHPAWSTRQEVLERVKQILAADGTPLASRLALWPVFAEAHRELNMAQGYKEERKKGRYTAALRDDLEWTRMILERRSASVEELSEARAVWDWHRRFEEDPELKASTMKLEELYANDKLAKEFEELLSNDDWKQKTPRAKAKAAELASSASADAIAAFVDRGARFIGNDGNFAQLYEVAGELGQHAPESESVRDFVLRTLSAASEAPRRIEFVLVVAAGWVFYVRDKTPEQTAPLVESLLAACSTDAVRVQLLMEVYGRVPRPRGLTDFTANEHALLRRQGALFTAQGRTNQYIAAVAATLKYDWTTAQRSLEDLVRDASVDDRPTALRSLLYAVFWVVRESEEKDLPQGLGEWLLNQLVLLPDFDNIAGNDEWHLNETLKRVGEPSVQWLPPVLAKRQELEATRAEDDYSRAISHHVRISRYVRPITAADASEPGVIQAIETLVGFIDDNGTAGYYLPEVLLDVDPAGLVVPAMVCALVAQATDAERVRRLARIGGEYAPGTPAWTEIAKAVLRSPLVQSADHQRAMFNALGSGGVKSWSGTPGEVPPVFLAEVESAKSSLAAATDEGLRRYWTWRVSRAEADLHEEEQRAKEERGE